MAEPAGAASEAPEPAAEAERQFLEEVFRDEVGYVHDRRASQGLGPPPPKGGGDEDPVVPDDLVGLAFSGGGIRSATFNLGLLQALHQCGFLRMVDYLSTVSGGGFIGSALTALLSEDARKRRDPRAEPFPFRQEGREESETVRWLRGHSDYLAPQGVQGYLRGFALFARGIALNLLLLLPVLLVVILLGTIVYDDDLHGAARQEAWTGSMRAELARLYGPEPGVHAETGQLEEWLESTAGLDPGAVVAALEREPPLVEDRDGVHHFRSGASWEDVAVRLAAVDEARPVERVLALFFDPPQQGANGTTRVAPIVGALTYGNGAGFRGWGFDEVGEPAWSATWTEQLWTDRLPVSAAAVGPRNLVILDDEKQDQEEESAGFLVAAGGYDGSLWLWPSEELRKVTGRGAYSIAEDRRLKSEDGRNFRHTRALALVAFSRDGSWLIAAESAKPDAAVFLWKVLKDPKNASTRPPFVKPGDRSGPLCQSCRLESVPTETARIWAPYETRDGVVLRPREEPGWRLVREGRESIELAHPRAEPPPEVVDSEVANEPRQWVEVPKRLPTWDPWALRLPMTVVALKWLLILFVGLYPLLIVLAGPLERLHSLLRWLMVALAVLAGLVLAGGRSLAAKLRKKRPDAEAKRAEKRFGGWAVFALSVSVIPAWLLFYFVGYTEWKSWTMGWAAADALSNLLLWWILCIVFLVPMLRAWRSRPSYAVRSRSLPRAILRALILLAPCALLAFFTEIETEIELRWLLAWPALFLVAAAPLLRVQSEPGAEEKDERKQRILHRRLSAGIYVAANALPWAAIVWAFKDLEPAPYARSAAEAVLRLAGEGDAASLLVRTAFWLLLAGLGYLFWKAFAALACGTSELLGRRSVEKRTAPAANSLVWRNRYETLFGLSLVLLAAIFFLEIQSYVVYHYHQLVVRYDLGWTTFVVGVVSFLAIVLAAMSLPALKGLAQKAILLVLGILGPLLPFLVYLTAVDALVYGENWSAFRRVLHPDSPILGVSLGSFLMASVAFGAFFLGKLVDANSTSMHGFYRDRLSQAYLVGVDTDGELGPEDELSLSEVCPLGSGAPYHLINASLNMQGESAGALRWRHSDFFVFSKLWCGGPHSEYCRTEHLEHLAPNVHLGSAMAVSGAAASPNMGSYTSGFLVMLMTLLNVRLGLWVPSPRRVRHLAELGLIGSAKNIVGRLRRWWQRLKNRPSGYYLVNEMASRLDASGPYVNLSDGGHLENTGAYELLRRRCRFIVISDAESDPAMHFGSVAALMRFASIDLGVEIEIDLEPLRLRKAGTSKGHWAVGTIHYPARDGGADGETGHLLYVKASVDGGESEIIREYRARHPDFPQESTADQVFEEDQFEAYRALGHHIGEGLFGSEGAGPLDGHADLGSWFAALGRSKSAETPAAGKSAPG